MKRHNRKPKCTFKFTISLLSIFTLVMPSNYLGVSLSHNSTGLDHITKLSRSNEPKKDTKETSPPEVFELTSLLIDGFSAFLTLIFSSLILLGILALMRLSSSGV